MEDARTMGRWYLVTTMGRNAGHLALGMGVASGATVTLIPEEFEEKVPLAKIADVLTGSIIKRLAMGRDHGWQSLQKALQTDWVSKILLQSRSRKTRWGGRGFQLDQLTGVTNFKPEEF